MSPLSPATAPHLLMVDDDETFRAVLAGALTRRGYFVTPAADAASALAAAQRQRFDYVVVDLNMPGPSGLSVVQHLAKHTPRPCIVVLTGYASIATAVEAIKLGATQYLAKPTDVDTLIAAFGRTDGDAQVGVAPRPMSVDRLEWEHLQKTLADCAGNISAAARRLGMHRRTLQRKLGKRPVRA